MPIHKIKAGYISTVTADQYVGESGTIFYNSDTGDLRLSDGSTLGGTLLNTGGGSYSLPTASADIKGGVKIGNNISITDGIISVAAPFSGNYSDLTNKPTLFSGNYTDLTNKPTLFSGSYTDLTDKPTIPTNTNQLTNGAGYITSSALSGYATETFVTSQGYLTSVNTVIKVADTFGSQSPFKSEVVADLATGVRISTWWGLPAFATEERWTFDYDGILTFPDSTEQSTAWTGTVTTLQWTASSFLPSAPAQTTVTAGDGAFDVNLVTGIPGSTTSVNWSFTNQGTIEFPDGTTQTSAYTGDSSTTEALTIGTGLSGTSFNGSTPVTIAIDNTVALRADTHYIGTTSIALNRSSASQTLTGVSIDGNAATATKLATARAINGVNFDGNANITIKASTSNVLTIGTGLSGTSFDGGTAVTIALADGYGDTKNPYASKTANYVLAAPNGSNGAPTFRAIVAADIPTLNQNTTGSAATLTTARNINGVSFNGSADITVTAAAGTLTGNTLASGVTASSLTSVGILTGLTVTSTNSSSSNVVSITGVTSPANGSTATWNFQTEGTSIGSYGSRIRFPDGSYQYTAWTGTAAAGTLTGTTLNSTVVTSSLTSVGTLTGLAVTTTTTSNAVNVTYTPSSANGAAYFATGKDTAGGTGYFDFLRATNTTSGVTNATKTFRVNSVGTLEILNSAYDATILSVTDAGFIAINASTGTTNGVPVNNAIAMNNNSYIYDDGNYHLTAKIGQIWLNSNDGSAVSINQQMPSGITAGGLKVTGPVNAQSAYYGRTPWNSAIDTEVTIDDYRFRISNSGGIFPQVISNTSGNKNSAWTVVAARSGSAITQTGSTGTLVPNNSWTSLYTSGGMDSAGDTFVATLQDKNEGRIYRITFMRSDNGSTTGYNIIAERLL